MLTVKRNHQGTDIIMERTQKRRLEILGGNLEGIINNKK